MIQIGGQGQSEVRILFVEEGGMPKHLPAGAKMLFSGEYLQTTFLPVDASWELLVGLGDKVLDKCKVKEVCAKAVKECRDKKLTQVDMDIAPLLCSYGVDAIRDIIEGVVLGEYQLPDFKEKQEKQDMMQVQLLGVAKELIPQAQLLLEEALAVAEGVIFARDMVNYPGNHLRPEDFANRIIERMEGLKVESVCYNAKQLREMGMEALLAVGESSEFLPCMLVLRYHNAPESSRITGLIGKGVTCDTGGYCLKAANSMLGIKGDMAGGAAVAGAVYALAKQQIQTNVTAVIPICENRISRGSLLPGDVISSYSGKTIEIGNTDAEGRLILADAVSYAVAKEQVTELLDIATLTGAVVNLLGFSIAGAICDEESWYQEFEQAYELSGERYLRIPFYEEHEKMIESKLADVRNISNGGCGTITAGLFIRKFAQERPWLHLDIAGTAWVDSPLFEFQSSGATGAGVTTIYQLCRREG